MFEAERLELHQEPGRCMHVHVPRMLESDVFVDLLFSSLLLSNLELSDTTVYESQIRALLVDCQRAMRSWIMCSKLVHGNTHSGDADHGNTQSDLFTGRCTRGSCVRSRAP